MIKWISEPRNILDAMVIFFASWAISSHFGVVSRLSLFDISVVFPFLAGVVFYLFSRIRETPFERTSSMRRKQRLEMVPVNISLLVFILFVITKSPLVLWGGFMLLFFINIFISRNEPALTYSYPPRERDQALSLVFPLAVLCAIISLFILRQDHDDSEYFNRAAYVASHFFETLPNFWTLFADKKYPAPSEAWNYLSYYDFVGLLSFAFGMEPLQVAAFIMTPLFSMLLVFAYYVLISTIMPHYRIMGLVVLLTLLFADGSAAHSFANYGFVKIWQGESILYHVLLPFTLATSLWFGSAGGLKNALRILALNVVGLSFSVSGYWLLPLATALGVLIGAYKHKEFFARSLAVLLLVFYPLLFGLLVFSSGTAEYMVAENARGRFFELLIHSNFDSIKIFILWLFMIFAACNFAPNVKAQRFVQLYVSLVFLTILNPFFLPVIFENFALADISTRIMWIFSLPLLGVLAFTSLFNFSLMRMRALSALLCILALAAYVVFVPVRPLLSAENGVRIAPPSVKHNADAYEAAEFMTARLARGSYMIAPVEIGRVTQLFKNYSYSVFPRKEPMYRHMLKGGLIRKDEYLERMCVTYFVAKEKNPCAMQLAGFLAFADARGIKAVALRNRIAAKRPELAAELAARGFAKFSVSNYKIFLHKDAGIKQVE